MSEVRWIKIVTDIFDDEKILLIESLPEADSIIVIWFKLLCLAGKQNNSGVFSLNGVMPYTEDMFSIIFRRKPTTVSLALKTFERFGMIEIINDTITIPNWGKHQAIDQLEAKKQYMKTYMADYRQKQLCKTNSKTNSKANVSRTDKDIYKEDIEKIKDKTALEIAIDDFKEFRKKIKSPMTNRAVQLFQTELNKLTSDDDTKIAIINQSIVQGWKGIFPLKSDNQLNKPPGFKPSGRPPQAANYGQRNYTDDELNKLYANK
jgi:predicted phage replisome organizer